MEQGWANLVQAAFPKESSRILSAVNKHPIPDELAKLFVDLASYVKPLEEDDAKVPANSKKRKLEDVAPAIALRQNGSESTTITKPAVVFECSDVSFQVPARKKLKFQLVGDAVQEARQEVRLLHPLTNEIEHILPVDKIDQVFCLPVPEKQQRQWNFCLFPKADAANPDGTLCDQVVFTMNETSPTQATWSYSSATEDDTFVSMTQRAIDQVLREHGKHVTTPSEAEFASSIPQSHRKGEKAYHVKAHKGSKEGYLFFLGNGIVFGFKKPLAFFSFSSIQSISYTSVLQRTFNLVISTIDSEGAEVKDVEFSMIDQADFAGIDEYVKRQGLNDASMAAERRAKAYNVNKDKERKTANGDTLTSVDDGPTELQKAEQQLQDEEDEEEEDYEASGGESDGEGEESDEEEEVEYEEYEEGGSEEGGNEEGAVDVDVRPQ